MEGRECRDDQLLLLITRLSQCHRNKDIPGFWVKICTKLIGFSLSMIHPCIHFLIHFLYLLILTTPWIGQQSGLHPSTKFHENLKEKIPKKLSNFNFFSTLFFNGILFRYLVFIAKLLLKLNSYLGTKLCCMFTA